MNVLIVVKTVERTSRAYVDMVAVSNGVMVPTRAGEGRTHREPLMEGAPRT